jgi:ubiquinone/menaquinone biosynthesis C-methylase UbiE
LEGVFRIMKSKVDNWNATLYDGKHSFVSKFGEELIDMLALMEGERILDLGCGTGDLAYKLDKCGVHVVGVDMSESMIKQAISKYPNLKFEVRDATDLHYKEVFDAVFSNATLHWVKPPKKALDSMHRALKHGGRFVAEFGGKDNVKMITDQIIIQSKNVGINFDIEQFPWYFPSIAEYSTLMEEAGFRVTFANHFDRNTPLNGEDGLRNWIEMFASGMFEGVTEETKNFIIAKVEDNLKDVLFYNDSWFADYKRIRIIGIKE